MIGTYEWCVMHSEFKEPHRGPWSEEDCRVWVKEAVEEDGFVPGLFYVAKRWCGDWLPEDKVVSNLQ